MTDHRGASEILATWPELAREAAQLVVNAYGEPHEGYGHRAALVQRGPLEADHGPAHLLGAHFPAPHHDSVESVIDYRVPVGTFDALAAFDGSVVAERTTGELSARCHDEQANLLALNLAHEIVTGDRTVDEAREYYAKECLDARRNKPTPYMNEPRFPASRSDWADPDERVLSDEDLERAQAEGANKGG